MTRLPKPPEIVGLPLLKQSVKPIAVLLSHSQKYKRWNYTSSLAQAVLADFQYTLPEVSKLFAAMESQGLARSEIKNKQKFYILSRKAIVQFLDGDIYGKKGVVVDTNAGRNEDSETYKYNINKSGSSEPKLGEDNSTPSTPTVSR